MTDSSLSQSWADEGGKAPAGTRVLHVASEVYPLVKTGGLADVAAALPAAQASIGIDARLLVPGYPAVLAAASAARPVLTMTDLFGGGPARLLVGAVKGLAVPAYVLECPGHYARDGNPYLGPDGADWPDNHLRFAALGWVAARLGQGADGGWRPAIVHGHDWQAGLAPAYLALAAGPRPATVTTIHNLAYQGLFPAAAMAALDLPDRAFAVEGLEFHGQVGFLKAGLYYADRITTVSRTYAREIQEPDQGCGLDGLLRARGADLVGIVNGIDTAVWDPATDPHLPLAYSADRLDGKAAAKQVLQQRFDLPVDPHAPLFGMVTRLNRMKGVDLLIDALHAFIQQRAQLVVLGSGDRDLEAGLRWAMVENPRIVAVQLGYDEALAHLIQAGADITLVPSRSEPCGLTQLYALRYGALPLVRRTGGLADTVVNADPANVAMGTATGFLFNDPTPAALAGTIGWACGFYRDHDVWRRMQHTAMTRDFGWSVAARDYDRLYRTLVSGEMAQTA
ncbi:MAG: glycogen synthase GlgA [Inquilinaceae bacterium]